MNERGRSMIEMLGVLAIIGVLSVGAIAGYSKAMFKYKLNKQAEQINTILSNLIINGQNLQYDLSSIQTKNAIPVLTKLNIFPEEMLVNASSDYIYDAFKNRVDIRHDTQNAYMSLSIRIINDHLTIKDQCLNLTNLVKNYAQYIWFSQTNTTQGTHAPRIYGDNYCHQAPAQKSVCYKDVSIAEFSAICEACNNVGTCSFGINWYVG